MPTGTLDGLVIDDPLPKFDSNANPVLLVEYVPALYFIIPFLISFVLPSETPIYKLSSLSIVKQYAFLIPVIGVVIVPFVSILLTTVCGRAPSRLPPCVI